jgi:hypothetical protein
MINCLNNNVFITELFMEEEVPNPPRLHLLRAEKAAPCRAQESAHLSHRVVRDMTSDHRARGAGPGRCTARCHYSRHARGDRSNSRVQRGLPAGTRPLRGTRTQFQCIRNTRTRDHSQPLGGGRHTVAVAL